ncbi:MAG TPA: CU044_5270 family protein [Streptosporangiaceae bacterium]|jgi:hypothetical protein
MDELKELEDFRAAVAPPEAGTLARARTRMLTTDGEPAPRPRWRRAALSRQVAKVAGIGAVAAGVAVAATVALITPSTPSSTPSTRPPAATGGAHLDAKIVLQRAAAEYLSLPAPHGDQYLYSEVRTVAGRTVSTQRSWMSADGSRPNIVGWSPCRQLPASTRISAKLRKYYDSCVFHPQTPPGPRAETTYSGMQSLPRQPAALLAYLAQHNECSGFTQADGEWGQVYGMFALNPVVPPAFGAALLRAAAQIPGVLMLPEVSFAGGTYVGVARTLPPGESNSWQRIVLIFDPRSYRLVGMQVAWSTRPIAIATGAGTDVNEISDMLVQASVTNSAPVIPSGLGLIKTVPGPPLSCGFA